MKNNFNTSNITEKNALKWLEATKEFKDNKDISFGKSLLPYARSLGITSNSDLQRTFGINARFVTKSNEGEPLGLEKPTIQKFLNITTQRAQQVLAKS